MKRKKGFTLIELLAVIVILAIIALIATPIVMNVIKKSRQGAAKDSTYGIIKAAETYYAKSLLDNVNFGGVTFTCNSSDMPNKCSYKNSDNEIVELEFNGTKPTSGTIKITNYGKVEIKDLIINNYICNYKKNSNEVECLSNGETSTTTTTTLKKYIVYIDGTEIYYNPVAGTKCSKNEAVSTTGTKTGCLKFYTFNDKGENASTINLILDHNTTPLVSWNSSGKNSDGMNEAQIALENDTTGWRETARLISADEIAEITGAKQVLQWTSDKTYADTPTIGTNISWFYLDGKNGTDSTWKTQVATSQGTSEYAWLFNNLLACTSYGCDVSDDNKYLYGTSGSTNKLYGYWTSSFVVGASNDAWVVYRGGLGNTNVGTDNYYGIRPVITISKFIIQ